MRGIEEWWPSREGSLWGEWYAWSTCSASCGEGQKHRSRSVAVVPQGGGAACEALTKREAVPCNNQLCEACVDGLWGDWGEWEACSATCSSAFSLRRRNVAQEPSACGRPVSGLRHEYRACSQLPPCEADRDCELSAWAEWSPCSSSCFGVQERNRYIKVSQLGAGAHCDLSALKETAACNPLTGQEAAAQCKPPGPRDCLLSYWEDWTACSKSCGGGQRERRRRVLTLPRDGGKACSGELTAVGPCGSQPCEQEVCVDCKWGLWSEWGDCDSCHGHKYRHRSIEQMPNYCGRMCDLKSAKEVTNCTGKCDVALVCAWTEWSAPSGCSTACGDGTMMRSRALSLLPAAGRGMGAQLFEAAGASSSCLGAQLNMSACPELRPCEPPCVPLHCSFQAWGEWSEPAASGLCERRRAVASVNNECGRPCEGAMGETKRCVQANAGRRDCQLSEWTAWGECKMNGKGGQQHRERSVLQQPALDGAPCSGALEETQRCNVLEPEDCQLGQWGDWSDCEKSCGGGLHVRERRVLKDAAHGGRLCEDSLREMRLCNVMECYEPLRNCEYSGWSSWSGCGAHNQRYRERKVLTFAEGQGQACEGDLEETQACLETPVDCVYSDWTAWDSCDKTCGGGQAQRHRQIMVFPENGGAACPPDLAQTMGCSESPCGTADCQVSDWQEWSSCSASCGPAHRERQRQLLQQAGPGGAGCNLELRELSPCTSEACPRQGCEWGDWEEWTVCPVSCGGGQQQRSRMIARMPEEGGSVCEPRDKEQVRPCSEQLCARAPCTDGLWSDWEEWSGCSATCGGGTSFRLRKVAQMADFCGEPVTGDSRETRFCNTNVACDPPVDCLFSDWGVWSACSQTCSGVMTRSRRIDQFGSGAGSFCNGHLKQTSPCNPSPLETTPAACAEAPPVDCVVSEWSLWGKCSASCDGGQQTRSRQVLTPPANGGQACEAVLTVARQCGSERCPGPAPVDCAFGPWQDWGACAKCDGQRTRFRHITQYPKHGGKACEPFEAEEASACPRACHEKQYCAWGDWAAWGECTAKCGDGKRMRRRYLGLTSTPSAPPAPMQELLDMYSQLQQQTGGLRATRSQELLLAFAGGFFSFVVALLGARTLVAARRHQRGPMAALHEQQDLDPDAVVGSLRDLRASRASDPLVMDA